MKAFLHLSIITFFCLTYAQKNHADETADRDALILRFTHTDSYPERLEIFNKLVSHPREAAALFTDQDSLTFKKQLLFFLRTAVEKEELDESDHIAVLSDILKSHTGALTLLKPLAYDHLSPYISRSENPNPSLNNLLTDINIPMDLKQPLLKEHLLNNICNPSVISAGRQIITSSQVDMPTRIEVLRLFLKVCGEQDNFQNTIVSLAVNDSLEWTLKEQILLEANKAHLCSDEIINHLFQFFYENLHWRIRDTVIWILSETKQECAQRVITFFSEFVQKNMEELPPELLEFRQTNIQSVLWALVRLGIQHPDIVVDKLKEIAMKHDINTYFRVRAVEALQDLSLYHEPAGQALYEIVRDNKRIATSDFVTYAQQIRDDRDTEVRNSAFFALLELVKNKRTDYLSFLFIQREKLDADQLYRKKAFSEYDVPDSLDTFARPALMQLVQDKKVDEKYRSKGLEILEQ